MVSQLFSVIFVPLITRIEEIGLQLLILLFQVTNSRPWFRLMSYLFEYVSHFLQGCLYLLIV